MKKKDQSSSSIVEFKHCRKTHMAAIGLAIIGKNDSPLYVREFLWEPEPEDGVHDEAVLFGLKPMPTMDGSKPAATASGRCWFVLHAALDRLEQLTKTPDGKKKTIPGHTTNNNNNFLGVLLPLEETRVYGYLTNSQTKFVLIVEDEGPSAAETSVVDVQHLLEEIHELYVREVMNPFNNNSNANNDGASNRLSSKFDEHIQGLIANFNQTGI